MTIKSDIEIAPGGEAPSHHGYCGRLRDGWGVYRAIRQIQSQDRQPLSEGDKCGRTVSWFW